MHSSWARPESSERCFYLSEKKKKNCFSPPNLVYTAENVYHFILCFH